MDNLEIKIRIVRIREVLKKMVIVLPPPLPPLLPAPLFDCWFLYSKIREIRNYSLQVKIAYCRKPLKHDTGQPAGKQAQFETQ